MRVIGGIVGLWWKSRDGEFVPRAGAVAAPQFRLEMTEIRRGVHRAALRRHHGRDRIPEKPDVDHFPRTIVAAQLEKALVGPDVKLIVHSPSVCSIFAAVSRPTAPGRHRSRRKG